MDKSFDFSFVGGRHRQAQSAVSDGHFRVTLHQVILFGLHHDFFEVLFNVPFRLENLTSNAMQFLRGIIPQLPFVIHDSVKFPDNLIVNGYLAAYGMQPGKPVDLFFCFHPKKHQDGLYVFQTVFQRGKAF